jgi:hypothetical protein
LPDLVGSRRSEQLGFGPPTHRGGGESGLLEPTLERPCRRQRGVGIEPLTREHHADQSRSPGGVVATHLEDGLHQSVGRLGGRQTARVVRRRQRVQATKLEPTQEVANRARGQIECRGDGGDILPVSEPLPDRLTD